MMQVLWLYANNISENDIFNISGVCANTARKYLHGYIETEYILQILGTLSRVYDSQTITK